MTATTNTPPKDIRELAKWFSEAVNIELQELESKKNEKHYELLSGRRSTEQASQFYIYHFTLADDALIPDDASGILEIGSLKFQATVLSQENDRISVQIEGAGGLDSFVPRALLRVDTLGLIRKLAESLEGVASNQVQTSHLMSAIFHPDCTGACRIALPSLAVLDSVADEQRAVLEQACGSPITYVWGPPGTGKTYVIAHLIAALIENGERVLMTSHTNAAVDQSVIAAAKPDGPLNFVGHNTLADGKIVNLNRDPKPEVPDSTRLDRIVEKKSDNIQSRIMELECLSKPLLAAHTNLKLQLAERQKHAESLRHLDYAIRNVEQCRRNHQQRSHEHKQTLALVNESRSAFDRAAQAWFFRATKMSSAKDATRIAMNNEQNALGRVD